MANTSLASARSAAAAFGLPRPFESAGELVASPDIDVVVITVKVPQHRQLVIQAIEAGKSVYCEWPLGAGPEEAIAVARRANESSTLAVIGTQALASPEVKYIRKIVADGYVGDVLSSTYIGVGPTWGSDLPQGDVYALDSKNGATLLSVIGGHAISAIHSVLGPIEEVGAVLSQRRRRLRVIETGEMVSLKTPDQVLMNGVLRSGAPLSLHLRGGLPGGTALLWEINGSAGDLRVTAKAEQIPVINISPLRVEGGRLSARSTSRRHFILVSKIQSLRATSPAFIGCWRMICLIEPARPRVSMTPLFFTRRFGRSNNPQNPANVCVWSEP